jgi:hypothetical protein
MNKIKVDPLTFKIINKEKQTVSTSESEADYLSSSNSDTDSIKVIKLDTSEQSGGQPQAQAQANTKSQLNTQQQMQQQLNTQQQTQQQQTQQQQTQQQQTQQQRKNINNNSSLNYLRFQTNKKLGDLESDSESDSESDPESDPESNLDEITNISSSNISLTENESVKEESLKENHVVQEKGSTDIIDLTKSQLHEVLYSIFTDAAGDNISENILKMNKLFETHNQIMEKILNQLIIMNSNHKEITVPKIIQKNTEPVTNLNTLRQNIKNNEKIENTSP